MSAPSPLELCLQLADEARRHIHRLQTGPRPEHTSKGNDTPVTAADVAINDLVVERVRDAFPDHGVLAEERSLHPDRPSLFVCDPVDGTLGLVAGLGTSTFTIAHVVDGQLQCGVIDLPSRGERIVVADGHVRVNRGQLRLSPRPTIDGARVGWEVWRGQHPIAAARSVLLSRSAWPVSLCAGVTTGALVAHGVLDAMVTAGRHPWDLAVVAAAVEALGGVATDLHGRALRFDRPCCGMVLGPAPLHAELLDLVTTGPHTACQDAP